MEEEGDSFEKDGEGFVAVVAVPSGSSTADHSPSLTSKCHPSKKSQLAIGLRVVRLRRCCGRRCCGCCVDVKSTLDGLVGDSERFTASIPSFNKTSFLSRSVEEGSFFCGLGDHMPPSAALWCSPPSFRAACGDAAAVVPTTTFCSWSTTSCRLDHNVHTSIAGGVDEEIEVEESNVHGVGSQASHTQRNGELQVV